jgi:hypothetical protein
MPVLFVVRHSGTMSISARGSARGPIGFQGFPRFDNRQALSDSIDRDSFRQFRRDAGRAGYPDIRARMVGAIVWSAVLCVIALFVLVLVVGIIVLIAGMATQGNPAALLGAAVLSTAGVGYLLVRAVRALIRREIHIVAVRRRWYRLSRFAAANRLDYQPEVRKPPVLGSLFAGGSGRVMSDVISTPFGRAFEIGSYRFSGDATTIGSSGWGFMRIQLARQLPHMVMLARVGPGRLDQGQLPVAFRRDQMLSLEGDFDRYFTLYAPREYERDALYVFTPDLMALLVDELRGHHVEIVDDRLLIYSPRPFDLLDTATWDRVTRILDTVAAKSSRQTDKYRDDRSGNSAQVAPGGRRLRLGISVAAVIGVGFTIVQILRVVLQSMN